MAIPQTSNAVAEIIMSGTAASAGSDAQVVQNVYHFMRITGGPYVSSFDLSDIESKFQTNIAVVVLALLNVRYTQTYTTCRPVNDPLILPHVVTHTGVGVITGDSMPSDDTGYCKTKSLVRGKSYRGNKKYGPMSESDSTTTSDIFNAGAIARFATLIAAIQAGWADGLGYLWLPCIYSRKNDKLVTKPSVAAVVQSSMSLNKRIGRLKRREAASVY